MVGLNSVLRIQRTVSVGITEESVGLRALYGLSCEKAMGKGLK